MSLPFSVSTPRARRSALPIGKRRFLSMMCQSCIWLSRRTGYARNAIVHQGRLDPGIEVIFKPFTYSDLAFKMRRILDS